MKKSKAFLLSMMMVMLPLSIVDGGTILAANLVLVPGCTLILRNGGTINMAPGMTFEAPIGAVVTIESGEIL